MPKQVKEYLLYLLMTAAFLLVAVAAFDSLLIPLVPQTYEQAVAYDIAGASVGLLFCILIAVLSWQQTRQPKNTQAWLGVLFFGLGIPFFARDLAVAVFATTLEPVTVTRTLQDYTPPRKGRHSPQFSEWKLTLSSQKYKYRNKSPLFVNTLHVGKSYTFSFVPGTNRIYSLK